MTCKARLAKGYLDKRKEDYQGKKREKKVSLQIRKGL